MEKSDLLNRLENETKVFKNPRIKEAFLAIDRKDFISSDYEVEVYEDYPLPIGFGQTISQPTTVAFMLELLDVKENDTVLDLGSGSGWTTALLAYLVGNGGEVIGIEKIKELVDFGQKNLAKYHFETASIIPSENEIGMNKKVFDKILVSADVEEVPQELLEQLEIDGVLVIPVQGVLHKIIKKTADEFEESTFPGFSFVPLIT